MDTDDAFPYFRIGVKYVNGFGGKRLAGELFEAAQLVTSPLVARQIAQVYARLESGSAEVSNLLSQLQDAQARRERIRRDLDSDGLNANKRRELKRYSNGSARTRPCRISLAVALPGCGTLCAS